LLQDNLEEGDFELPMKAKAQVAPGTITMTAIELMRAADALTGVQPGMSHKEISERQDVTREELEERYEQFMQAQEAIEHDDERSSTRSNSTGRVQAGGDLGEGIRGLEADGLSLA
jgi:hypothetical protein